MDILIGIKNFLNFINDNWVNIVAIITLMASIVKKAKDYLNKSDEEKIAIAKSQIEQTILRMITEAEISYEEWQKSGEIKRSQVIEEIFIAYPILSKVTNQTELIEWIDNQINESLKILRKVIEENKDKATE